MLSSGILSYHGIVGFIEQILKIHVLKLKYHIGGNLFGVHNWKLVVY